MKFVGRLLILSLLLALTFPTFAQGTVIDATNAHDLVEVMRLGRGIVENAQFSPDGEQIIVGSSIGVWIYDTAALDTETDPALAPTSEGAELVEVSPDGEAILVALGDVLQVWVDGEVALEVDTDSTLTAVEASPDGAVVATAHSFDDDIRIWPDPTEEPTMALGHTNTVNDLAFSPDSSILASASDDGTVRLWDAASGEELAIVETGVSMNVLEFTPDGSALLTGDDNGILSVWDAASGELLMAFEEGSHDDGISALAVSSDGTWVATGDDWNGEIRLWNIAEGEQQSVGSGDDAEAWILPDRGEALSLEFSSDGSVLLVASEDEFVGLYDIETRELLMSAAGHTDGVQAFDFNPDGSLLTLSDDDGDVWIWKVGSDSQIAQLPHIEEVGNFSSENATGLAYAPDGSYIVVASSFEVVQLNPENGEEIARFEGEGLPESIAISPDSSLIAVTSSQNLSVFSVESGLIVAEVNDHTEWLGYVEFSPDQTLLVTSSNDGTVRVYGVDE